MRKLTVTILALAVITNFCFAQDAGKSNKNTKRVLWTDKPVIIDLTNVQKPRKYFQRMWDSSVYPIGNGRLGCVTYGEPQKETIQFNEDSVWLGKPHDYAHPGAADQYPVLRGMMLEMLALERQEQWEQAREKQAEAEKLAMETFMSEPLRQTAYQPTGDLLIQFPEHENPEEYCRSLDLDSAVAAVSYR